MKKLALISGLILLTSCASDSDSVKTVNTDLKVKGQVGSAKLGLDNDNVAILQEEKQAQDELNIQEAVNMRLKDEANHYHGELRECLSYLADKRLGGNGKIPDLPDIDNLQAETDTTEEFGQTEDGSLKVVKKTSFIHKLKNARSYDKSLRAMTKLLSKQNDQCQMDLEIARNKAGLPGKKTQAQGYFNEKGNWVETKKGESNLNDAFEIQSDNSAKGSN
ncbi:hypothetical protein [Oligoflexus tunisiensis]|uniref:hypothetical protein n=1 Tax=Oligoflexus tunisiensis TaxID=708132 RepID=UPI00114D0C81|nr:hypothetical protein [Oligoflexus tunisiensis]